MTLTEWYEHARRDATHRDIPELEVLVETLHQATTALRQADWAVRGTLTRHNENNDTS